MKLCFSKTFFKLLFGGKKGFARFDFIWDFVPKFNTIRYKKSAC